MDRTVAQGLAQAFLTAGLTSDEESFVVQGTQDQIVITITRTASEPVKQGLIKLSRSANSLSPYGSGQICGACGGTGRL